MSLLARLSGEARRLLLAPPAPRVAFEVRGTTLGAVKLSASGRELESAVFVDIPSGILDATSLETPVANPDAFSAEVERLCEQTRISRDSRIAVVLPDAVARLALVPRESMRGTASERKDVVRFRLRKLLPYDSHGACIAIDQQETGEALAVAVSQAALGAFEQPFREIGLDPGLVEVSGLAIVRGLVPERGDWLIVNWEPEYLSLLVVRDGVVLLTRNLSGLGIAGEQDVAREVANTTLYHRERLGGRPLAGAFLRASEGRVQDGARALEPSLGLEPTIVAPQLPGAPQQLPAELAGAGACLLAELT